MKILFIIAVCVEKISTPLRRFSCLLMGMVDPSTWKNKTNKSNNAYGLEKFAILLYFIIIESHTINIDHFWGKNKNNIFLTFERYNNRFGNDGRWWRYGCKVICGSLWYIRTIVAPPQWCLFRRSVFRTISWFSTHLVEPIKYLINV